MSKNSRQNGNIKLILGVVLMLALITGLIFIIAKMFRNLNGENIAEKPAATQAVVAENNNDKNDGKTPAKATAAPTKKAEEGTKKDENKPSTEKNDVKEEPVSTPTPTPTPRDIEFSEDGYLFSEDINVEIVDTTGKAGYITYTLDNTTPKKSSTVYSAPLTFVADDDDYPNCYTVRAKSFYNDGTESKEFVHSYLVNKNINERFSTTVMIISGDPSELTDMPNGILAGTNYKLKGSDSERVVHVEAISKKGKLQFSQFAGARVYGGTSREHAVKSIKLYARKKYDEENSKFKFDKFDTIGADGKEIKKYDRMVLRNGGDDFQGAFLREELMQMLAKQAGLDFTEASVPAVAFVNGEYYGYYWLHENYCDDFFQKVCGEAEGEYYVFEATEKSLKGGDTKLESELAYTYNQFYNKYSKADLTKDDVYAEVNKVIDVKNYLDYMAFNIYVDNYDWPQGNVKVMRYYSPTGSYEEGTYRDGRYYFLVHDSDIGTGCYGKGDICDADRDDIERVMNLNNSHSSALFINLMKRDECKNYFINKIYELESTVMSLDNVNEKLDELLAMRDGEMEYYINHLRTLKDAGIWCNMNSVKNDVETIRTFISRRPEFINKYIEKKFGKN
ncbi:MAG: CotH kinase family protein [Lachnospiraceae bacterium]|nr:CotH kinase family protein [Lachnospiraceae bacterium]